MKPSLCLIFFITLLPLGSCARQTQGFYSVDESDIYQVIRRDAFFYYVANRLYEAPSSADFNLMSIPYHFGEYGGYYVCYMKYGNEWCRYGFGHSKRDCDIPVIYEDGLVFNLLPCTSYPNYIAWKDHRLWVLSDAYELGYLTRSDMESVSNTISELTKAMEEGK